MSTPASPTPEPTPTPAPEPSLINQQPPPTGQVTPPATTPAPTDKPAEAKADAKADAKVPLTATDFTLPEGMSVSEATMKDFLGVANELGLSKEAATKLVNLQANLTKATSDESVKLWQTTQDNWKAELAKDPEFAGSNWENKRVSIGRLLDAYGSPELRQALDLTGAGNHPAVVKFFAKLATQVTEPGFVPAPSPDNQASVASKLYPTMV